MNMSGPIGILLKERDEWLALVDVYEERVNSGRYTLVSQEDINHANAEASRLNTAVKILREHPDVY
jgi:hypothetical protein